jgi:hypothetical protein
MIVSNLSITQRLVLKIFYHGVFRCWRTIYHHPSFPASSVCPSIQSQMLDTNHHVIPRTSRILSVPPSLPIQSHVSVAQLTFSKSIPSLYKSQTRTPSNALLHHVMSMRRLTPFRRKHTHERVWDVSVSRCTFGQIIRMCQSFPFQWERDSLSEASCGAERIVQLIYVQIRIFDFGFI